MMVKVHLECACSKEGIASEAVGVTLERRKEEGRKAGVRLLVLLKARAVLACIGGSLRLDMPISGLANVDQT